MLPWYAGSSALVFIRRRVLIFPMNLINTFWFVHYKRGNIVVSFIRSGRPSLLCVLSGHGVIHRIKLSSKDLRKGLRE